MFRFGSNSGNGRIKFIIALIVVVYVGSAGYSYFTQRVAHAELKDAVIEYIKFAGVKEPPWKVDDIKREILGQAKRSKITTLKAEQVEVTDDGERFVVKLQYEREFKVPGYKKMLVWNIEETWTKY